VVDEQQQQQQQQQLTESVLPQCAGTPSQRHQHPSPTVFIDQRNTE